MRSSTVLTVLRKAVIPGALVCLALACAEPDGAVGPDPGNRPTAQSARVSQELIARGETLFFEETFGGNGRTCATCHPGPTFTLTPEDIEALPEDDPLFNGELDIDPEFIDRALIQFPLGGSSFFDPDLRVQRGILGIFNLEGTEPFLTDGRADALPEQIQEAVLLHFLDGAVDDEGERLPTPGEVEALIAFMESVSEPDGDPGLDPLAARGEGFFFGRAACGICHFGPLFTDNDFHDTGVVNDLEGDIKVSDLPFDPGRCRLDPGANDCAASGSSFNTPQLLGGRHVGPFFHNNSRATLRGVVEFYNSDAFTNSPANQRLGIGALNLTEDEVDAITAFLESL